MGEYYKRPSGGSRNREITIRRFQRGVSSEEMFTSSIAFAAKAREPRENSKVAKVTAQIYYLILSHTSVFKVFLFEGKRSQPALVFSTAPPFQRLHILRVKVHHD